MQNVGIGDVIFIILVLGIIHGIMYFVTQARKRKPQAKDDSGRPAE
jgi:preprotein translocase subunit YajC